MTPAGLGTKNYCAGEDQQQFTGFETTVTQMQRLHIETNHLLVEEEAPF
jgi:hypothetical protein